MVEKNNSLFLKIILYEPEIAQNMGTIVRLCACFGIQLSVIEPYGFPFSSKALRRAMMDYGELTGVQRYINFQKYADEKKSQPSKNRMILFTTKGDRSLWDFKFSAGDHLFFGNEGHGVPDSVAEQSDVKIYIPMQGVGRSLNLAVSAGIGLGEATRQLTVA